MSFFSTLRGTTQSLFSIFFGTTRVQLKNNAGALEARNDADAAFVVTRGATPVAANDYTTKNYVDSAASPGGVQSIRFVFGNGATTSSATNVPAGSIVYRSRVKITTPFSAGGTISVGQTGSAAAFQATTDINAQGSAGDIFETPQDATSGAALPVLITVGGAPAAGAGVCIIEYSAVPQA